MIQNAKIKHIGKRFAALSEYTAWFVAAVLLAVIACINPMFVSVRNLSNILSDMSALLILSIGITYVLLIGSIDLSIGAVSSCACVIYAMSVEKAGPGGIVLALLFGVAAGLVSGLLYVMLKIPSFITTFGTMSIWQTLALLISQGQPRQVAKDYWAYTQWFRAKIGIFPAPFLIALGLFLVFLLIQSRTKFGKTLYAVGGNESAARIMGLDVKKTKIAVFALIGLLSAVAGIFFASNLKSGIPTVGEPFTLYAIAAAALGGTSLSGGKGGLVKTFAGVLLVILIQNGMNVIGVDVFWVKITFGVIILAALYATTDRTRRNIAVK